VIKGYVKAERYSASHLNTTQVSKPTLTYKVMDAFRLCHSPRVCVFFIFLLLFLLQSWPIYTNIASPLCRLSIYSSYQNQISAAGRGEDFFGFLIQKFQSDLIW